MKSTAKKLLSLLLAMVMTMSMLTPAFAAEPVVAGNEYVSAADLTALLGEGVPAAENAEQYTNQEVIKALLLWTGLTENQLGSYPDDYLSMADSMGMIEIEDYNPTAPCTDEDLAEMKAVANVMYEALHAETKEPLFMNGMAQPIFPYTTGSVTEGYSNDESDIIRFCVYVESNYDTDGDGKLDLVKAVVQVPRAAVEGDYKAATVYEARPYCAGTTDRGRSDGFNYTDSGRFDMSSLYAQPEARKVAGEISTMDHAATADSNDWYYQNRHDKGYEYEDLEWYDYYLVRGFAVVTSAGIGALGSQGYETCGSDLEIDAFKCVIEWLHGDRVAYTDWDSNIEIKAGDWSNGKVGMTGRSYAGTTQFGLATTGVEGLEAIVPVAGIGSWYDYTNAQGIPTRSAANYTETLAIYCASRLLDLEDWATISENYAKYLNELRLEQLSHPGDYGPTWQIRDYTLDWENINCSALIVHGVADYNVRAKNSMLMYQAFNKAIDSGKDLDVKVLLHQDGHLTPTYPAERIQFGIGDQTYDEILNKWFSHYLYDLDNGAEDMPGVISQDSHSNTWSTYESWGTDDALTLSSESDFGTVALTSNYSSFGVSSRNWSATFAKGSTPGSARFVTTLDKDLVLNGTVAVNFRAATEAANIPANGLMVSAMLVDLSDEEFSVFNTSGSYVPKTTLKENGAWMGGGVANYDLVEMVPVDVDHKVIARGWMDLCDPEAGYDGFTTTMDKRVEVNGETFYDYTLYLQPTIYDIEAGHELALVIYAYEPGMASAANYTINLDTESVSAVIPVEGGKDIDLTATYEPGRVTTDGVTEHDFDVVLGTEADTTINGAAVEAGHKFTNEEVVAVLLRWAGLKESQLGSYPYDYNAMAASMGMSDIEGYDPTAASTDAILDEMMDEATELYEALHAEKLEPLFMNDMAQPIFPYTTGAVTEGYDNANSDIIRFFVYVESNYDTDDDGKLDLVKTLVQVPRAAVEGDYKAATVYEARPYITGTISGSTPYVKEAYDISKLYDQPKARKVAGQISTMDHAATADSNEWYYQNRLDKGYEYEDLEWYDYYLVRGFAVVSTGGIGTLGSDGFETCGTNFEIDAFKCVIEWLHGDRVAYTDKENNIEIKAGDWSNGKVGMTGRSYAGTTQFGLATTGVEGLEAIVPVAGIASWYEYTNSQGVSTNSDPAYSDWLAWYCAGRYLDLEDWATISEKYGSYLYQLRVDQLNANGDYTYPHWGIRDYTLDWENIKAPALIVHGIGDYNVRTKQSDLMQQAYQKAGVDYKILLHQDGHLTPTYPANKYQFAIDNTTYDSILNKWFSHYLYDLDNGVENMPNVLAQDAHSDTWSTYESWGTDNELVLDVVSPKESITISSDYAAIGVTRSNWQNKFMSGSSQSNALFVAEVTEDMIINGSVAVNFSAATEAVDGADALMVTAILVDMDEEPFPVFSTTGSYITKETIMKGGAWMGGGLANYDLVKMVLGSTDKKAVSYGWMDLCNPEAKYDSATALRDNRVDVDGETYYDYTLYLQPTIYEVQAGHDLALVICAYDPSKNAGKTPYTFTMEVDSINAVIPVEDEESAGTLNAQYDIYRVETEGVTVEDLYFTLGDNVDTTINGAAVEAGHKYTNEELVAVLLRWAGLKEEQLGSFPYDYNAMADSLGMSDIEGYEPTAESTDAIMEEMMVEATVLYEALHAEKMEPLFMNGMAQPIFPYTTGAVEEGYDNANSDIIRFCVWVETNYDTDDDGKLDLVKALVQVPRAAIEGDYKAATIYEARPYITGCTDDGRSLGFDYKKAGNYDMSKLYSQPEARKVAGEMSTADHAANANSADWYYWNPYEYMYDYEDLTWYDYYLVRGFAVVEAGGLGTKGSEGFETCGSDLEIDAFKCIIEWLHGDRVAYTDKDSNIEIKADWANGKVGMTGRSYAGTTQFGLSTTGVAGLETIVPVAGIGSWYDYTNSQGIPTRSSAAYTDTLAIYCAGRMLDIEDWNTISEKYANYLNQLRLEQLSHPGDYGPTWECRDYTLDWENINCSALIVHGIADYNVRAKNSALMYQAFNKAIDAGKDLDVKVLLHQDGHLTPTYPAGNLQFAIGEQTYDEILNKWFSHYLYDLDNGAEDMPNVISQNSHGNTWDTYESWGTDEFLTMNAAAEKDVISVSSDYNAIGVSSRNWQQTFANASSASNAMFVTELTEDVVINGTVAVNFSAATDAAKISTNGLMVSAMLVDLSDEAFTVFNTSGSYVPKNMLMEGGAWMGGGLANFDLVEMIPSTVNYKVIARGWMDLCNPTAGYDGFTATEIAELGAETYHDYTIYLQPTIYDVQAGHKLALVIYAYEPGMGNYRDLYTIKLDADTVNAVIPVEGESSTITAEYDSYRVEGDGVTTTDLTYVLGYNVDTSVNGTAMDKNHKYTNEELVAVLLRWAGLKESQLGAYPYDYNCMAASMGMSDIEGYDPTAVSTDAIFDEMMEEATVLYEALHADKLEPLFMNDMAQPIFPYTTGAVTEGYDNANSDIIRFFVYVESNYDTDGDGKLDLVKTLVQVPRAAVEGDYKAATVYEARPYITGTISGSTPHGKDGYDISSMYAQPDARKVAGKISTMDHAATADSNEWYYQNRMDKGWEYEDLQWYDYYLVRGFAVVSTGGIGTMGSDGFETCGTDLEIDAFKCVIEWLHGDRVAYTDKENNIEIKAGDWANGKVGMTGRSYAGTTQFGLATTGVEGLETIVPVAGIASWYEYTNSQGVSTNSNPAYSDYLAFYCNGRYLDVEDWATISEKYLNYLQQLKLDQLAANGDYTYAHWGIRDYTLDWENIKAPALIVHGLADYNVRTKQSDLMQQAYQKAGVDYKILLHQDGHLTPTYPASAYQFAIGNDNYDSILNRWFSHYLYGLDNGVENMPNVLAQDAHSDTWSTYESWGTDNELVLDAVAEKETITISSDYASIGVTRSNYEKTFINDSTQGNALFVADVTENIIINGSVAVNFSAAAESVEGADALMVSAILVEMDEEAFPVFSTSGSYITKETVMKGGAWMGGGVANYDLVKMVLGSTAQKVITRGWMDLCNPEAKYDSFTALRDTRVDVNGETYYDYTIFTQPTIYEVQAGHKLALVIFAHDPSKNSAANPFTFTMKVDSIKAVVPVEDVESIGTMEVTYQPIDTVELTASAAKGGSVSATASGTIDKGTKVTLTAEANYGYEFVNWTKDGKEVSKKAEFTVAVLENTEYVANFVLTAVGGSSSAVEPEEPTVPVVPPVVEPEKPVFSDVDVNAWYNAAVQNALDKGLMAGTSANTFEPNAKLTRAMVVQILYSMEGKPAVSGAADFSDVAANDWFAAAVKWASDNKIVAGMGDGTFAPNANVTREQLAVILMAYAKFEGKSVSATADLSAYADASGVSTWAEGAMKWAVASGIISGKTATTLDAQGTATRAEVAQMIMKFETI